jgi:hypothetical protein
VRASADSRPSGGRCAWRAAALAACLAPALAHGQAAAPQGGDPPAQAGRLHLKPGLQVEAAEFMQDNAWFGQSRANIGAESTNWTEAVLTPSLDWDYLLHNGASMYGRLSGIAAFTDGVDAAGSNVKEPRISDFELEDSYVGWRSGGLLADTLGTDAVDISVGRRKYQVGSGFLFWKESNNGASRAANGIAPRKAARFAAIAKLHTHGWTLDTVYLKFNDRPSTHTRLAGADVSYTSKAWGVVGFGAYKVLGSDKTDRAGMTVLNLRADTHPIPQLRGLRLAGEYVHEENGDRLLSDAGFLGVGYTFAALPWAPYADYRRAIFRGDNATTRRSEAYDPFSLGISNWGSLLIGKYVRSDTDLRADTLHLLLQPAQRLKLTTEVYKMALDQTPAPGVSRDYADEVDLIADWAATRRLTLSLMGAVAKPKAAARESTGGDRTWTYLVVHASWAY